MNFHELFIKLNRIRSGAVGQFRLLGFASSRSPIRVLCRAEARQHRRGLVKKEAVSIGCVSGAPIRVLSFCSFFVSHSLLLQLYLEKPIELMLDSYVVIRIEKCILLSCCALWNSTK
jgi:hypothetical protein